MTQTLLAIINLLSLETFLAISGVVVGITQIIKLAPPAFTSNYPKTIAWIVTVITVGLTGYFTGADWTTTGGVAVAVGLAANGMYDVLSGLWAKFFGKK
jgi:hypothetical protein